LYVNGKKHNFIRINLSPANRQETAAEWLALQERKLEVHGSDPCLRSIVTWVVVVRLQVQYLKLDNSFSLHNLFNHTQIILPVEAT
jgi:hypothetical protein